MPKTIEIKIYRFSELTERSKEKAYLYYLENSCEDTFWIQTETESNWENFLDNFNIYKYRGSYMACSYGENTETWSFAKSRRYFIENWPLVGKYKLTKERDFEGNGDYEYLIYKELKTALHNRDNTSLHDVIVETKRNFELEMERILGDYTSFDSFSERQIENESENDDWNENWYYVDGTPYFEDQSLIGFRWGSIPHQGIFD